MAKATPTVIISHWSTMIQGLQESPQQFFGAVENAIKARSMPDARLSRVDWREGSLLSAKREYLRVTRKDHIFDVCGAPFGNGFFVSWWLGTKESLLISFLLEIPLVGRLVQSFIRPQTYYQLDTAAMFQSLIHAAVMEVIDGIMSAKGMRSLTEGERKPVSRDFFQQ